MQCHMKDLWQRTLKNKGLLFFLFFCWQIIQFDNSELWGKSFRIYVIYIFKMYQVYRWYKLLIKKFYFWNVLISFQVNRTLKIFFKVSLILLPQNFHFIGFLNNERFFPKNGFVWCIWIRMWWYTLHIWIL